MSYERPNVQAMEGYAYGEQPQSPNVIKLNTNENPYPPSPQVAAALSQLDVSQLRIYPDALASTLRAEIARKHDLDPAQVVVTNGGDEALRLAFTTFVEPGAGFGMADPSYSLYPVLAQIQDATIVTVALEPDWQLPQDTAAQLNGAGVQLTAIVNPHAPSGVLLSQQTLGQLAWDLDGVLLVDEAYVDFVDPTLNYNCASLLAEHDNLLILRTFSKGYSLAGLRLGYLLGNTNLIQPIVEKTRDSYNIDHLSQQLGLAALKDQSYAANTWQQIRDDRAALAAGLQQLGFTMPESHSNFLLARVPVSQNAADLYAALKAQGTYVRYFAAPRLKDCLRITVGTAQQNQQLLAQLSELVT